MMEGPRPELLLHPQIPKPLHGVAPRVVLGDKWWDRERFKAYAVSGQRCWACWVPKSEAKFHQWLEAHEAYKIDYQNGRMTLVEVVALCHMCHNFIHLGRLSMLVRQGKATEEFLQQVEKHGQTVIKALHRPHPPTESADWQDWRLVVEGKEYGPSTNSYEDWAAGGWKNWNP